VERHGQFVPGIILPWSWFLAGLDRPPTWEEQLSIGQALFLFGIVVLLAGMFFRKRAEAS